MPPNRVTLREIRRRSRVVRTTLVYKNLNESGKIHDDGNIPTRMHAGAENIPFSRRRRFAIRYANRRALHRRESKGAETELIVAAR